MLTQAPMTATERLRRYRSHHRIEIDNSGDWSTCDTDGLPVYQVLTRRWQHDMTAVKRLEKLAAAEMVAPSECVACHRSLPKGSEEEFLAILIADQSRLGLLCGLCQDDEAE